MLSNWDISVGILLLLLVQDDLESCIPGAEWGGTSTGFLPILWFSSSWAISVGIPYCTYVTSHIQGCVNRKVQLLGVPPSWRTYNQRLLHCHGGRKHIQFWCDPQGYFGTLAESHYDLWLFSCFWNLPFDQLFGIWLMRLGRIMPFGLGVGGTDRIFLALIKGTLLLSPGAQSLLPWGVDGDGRYNCTQRPIAATLIL